MLSLQHFRVVSLLVALLAASPALRTAQAADGEATVHHDLKVRLTPETHGIEVEDAVRIHGVPAGSTTPLTFRLHAALDVTSLDDALLLSRVPEADGAPATMPPLATWQVSPRDGKPWTEVVELRLGYRGALHHPPETEGEEYARSFARTAGTIGEEGVVLTRATWWVPAFGEELLDLPSHRRPARGLGRRQPGRRARSTRVGTADAVTTWDCPHPMDEVYLIAEPLPRVRARRRDGARPTPSCASRTRTWRRGTSR